jgi:ketosteroid isomerase-like protein
VTEDFHNEHTSALGHSLRGRQAYRERLPSFLAEFAGLRYEIEDVIAEGDRAAVPYTLHCTWSGQPVQIRGMFRFEVRDGLIAHRVDYWDSAEFQRQISQQERSSQQKRSSQQSQVQPAEGATCSQSSSRR